MFQILVTFRLLFQDETTNETFIQNNDLSQVDRGAILAFNFTESKKIKFALTIT